MREIKTRHMPMQVYSRERKLADRLEISMMVSVMFMILCSLIFSVGSSEQDEKSIDTHKTHVPNLSAEPVLQNRF